MLSEAPPTHAFTSKPFILCPLLVRTYIVITVSAFSGQPSYRAIYSRSTDVTKIRKISAPKADT